jgi:hypothetical protein
MNRDLYKLTDEQKIWLVQRAAAFESAGTIIKSLQQEFGITLCRAAVHYYNPNTCTGKRLSAKWKTLFYETRKAIIAGGMEIGVANKRVRLRRLETMAQDAMDGGDFNSAAKALAQAARETGRRRAKRRKYPARRAD